jgi:hypothetical protein
MKPVKNGELLSLEGISNSNYAEEKETRFSVYGYIIYFCGVTIAWKSKSGRSVTLLPTDAEYFAIPEFQFFYVTSKFWEVWEFKLILLFKLR